MNARRYEVNILLHDERTEEEIADVVLAVLPDNAVVSVHEIGEDD